MAATAQDITAWVAELLAQAQTQGQGPTARMLPSETGRLLPPDPTGANPYSSGVLGSRVPPLAPRMDVPPNGEMFAGTPNLDLLTRLGLRRGTAGKPGAFTAPMSGPLDTTEAADEPDPFPADATDVPDSVRLRNVPPDERVPPFATGTVTREPDAEAIIRGAREAEAARGPRPPPMAPRPGREALRQPSLWQYIDTALAGMAGGRPVLSAVGERAEARNATYDALIQRGASEDLARAITLNPAQFQSVLPSLFSPRTAIVNNRLVETATGRVIADFSDQFRPLPENTVGVLNQATGAVTTTPGLPGRRRDLSAEDIRKLRNEGSVLSNVGRLGEGFRNTFSSPNWVVGGDINNWIARNTTHGTPAQREAARWWQDYQRNVEIVERHEMFGAALTPTEQAAWRAADINPNMAPGMVRANLATRHQIMTRAMQRYAQALAASGYDATAISSAFGLTPDALGIRPGGRRDDALTTPPGDSGFRVLGVR